MEIDNVTLKPVESAKFLGMWLDQNLNWNIHVNKLIMRIKRNMHLLRTPKHLFSGKTLRLIYYAHIQSHIDYGLIMWGSMTTQENLSHIQLVQNKCVEIISKNKNTELNYNKEASRLYAELLLCVCWHTEHI